MPIEIEISDTQAHLKMSQATIARIVEKVLLEENRPAASISIALVDNETIHRLNRLHLGHDWSTDVITFPLSDPDDHELAGELVISAEMAVAIARELGADPLDELKLYIVHGLLHLCGYDDSNEHQSAAMTRRQTEICSALS